MTCGKRAWITLYDGPTNSRRETKGHVYCQAHSETILKERPRIQTNGVWDPESTCEFEITNV